jgi:hypothetical protein
MPAWFVVIGDKQGNPLIAPSGREQKLWFPEASFQSEADATAHVTKHFRNVTPLRAYQSDEQPGIVHSIPAKWYEFGTNRLKAEIDAGLRPPTEFLQPPLNLESLNPTARKGKVLWRKRTLS